MVSHILLPTGTEGANFAHVSIFAEPSSVLDVEMDLLAIVDAAAGEPFVLHRICAQ
jgi:hypothetical protein